MDSLSSRGGLRVGHGPPIESGVTGDLAWLSGRVGVTDKVDQALSARGATLVQGKSLLTSAMGELRGPTWPKRALSDCGWRVKMAA